MQSQGTFSFTGAATGQTPAHVTAAGSLSFVGAGTLNGGSHLTASGSFSFTLTGNLSATAHLNAAASLSFTLVAGLKATAHIEADGSLSFTGAAVGTIGDTWESDDITWDQSSAIDLGRYPVALFGQSFIQFNPAYTDFGDAPIASFVERTSLPPDDKTGVYLITDTMPLIRAEQGTTLQVKIGSQFETPEDDIEWEPAYNFIVGTDDSVDSIKSGSFMALRIEAEGQPHWRMPRIDISVERVAED